MKRRKTDWGSLVAGLLFIGLGAAFVVRGTGDWGFDLVWVLPVLAIGLGLAGIARALVKSRDRDAPRGG
ncbi:hypothetical protein [Nocardiopsis composta]|uniref:Uncharacterized membrane protein HdeD (DUF308 family) n=1 Tax=Nocardiopsis composta TaxID=157465 RepID=A0A7W8VED5_9ACTN|nr:hypothetical protein [Nocardiopsis composta]MBB5432985.1 uncharacterized membrane protein HdeD (DUF308 family) [Nocardiopsis composta]